LLPAQNQLTLNEEEGVVAMEEEVSTLAEEVEDFMGAP
jgi:hypothetical protein